MHELLEALGHVLGADGGFLETDVVQKMDDRRDVLHLGQVDGGD